MCLDCGAWTTGGSHLLAEPCQPEGITEARARGLKRFLRGLHPGKATSLSQEQAAKREGVQFVIDKINVPQLGTKRVRRAQQLGSKAVAKSKQQRTQQQIDGSPNSQANAPPTPPNSPQ